MITRRKAMILLAASAVSNKRAAATETGAKLYQFERGLMGTRFAIKCEAADPDLAKQAADAAFARAEEINEVASDYIADGELLSISKHPFDEPVIVSALLFRLISEARGYAEKTDGCFDPTLGPLTQLWRESRRRKRLPEPNALAAAREACGWRFLILDAARSSVRFQKPNMRLDLGGIAKGQAADAMLEEMKRHGMPRTCITAGGDIRAGDAPVGSEGWQVGIRTSAANNDSRVLTETNRGVSTSGSLYQFVEMDGKRYSHIVDPATGLGITRNVAATVVAPTATISDALATACCNMARMVARCKAIAAGAEEVYFAS